MTAPHVYDVFDPPPSKGLDCTNDPGLTQQQFKDECDINNLLDRYDLISQSNYKPAIFGDFAQVPDYQAALELTRAAQENFMDLPAKARERFQNDPARFLAFVNDPKNQEEAVQLGLALPKPKPVVQQVVVGTLKDDGTFVPQGPPSTSPLPPPTK